MVIETSSVKVKSYDEIELTFPRLMLHLEEAVAELRRLKVPPSAYISWHIGMADRVSISARWDKRTITPPEARSEYEQDVQREQDWDKYIESKQ
jgi:hypothetical protein